MRRALPLTCLLVVGAGAAVAACTSGPGSPPPAPSRLSPPITGDPLNLSRAATAPCGLLRPDQLAQYHLGAPGTATTVGGVPACAWSPAGSAGPSYQADVDLHSGGLEALYRRRATFPVFAPTKVSEYPAVHTAPDTAAQKHGRCTVQVKVAEGTLLTVTVTVPASQALDYTDPCPDADQFAASAIANAEGAAP